MSDSPPGLAGRFAWGMLAIVTACVIGLGAWTLVRSQSSSGASNLPMLFEVPAFSLTDQNNRTVSRADLLGHVWVADFVFTSCAGPCPLMTRRMADLRTTFENEPTLRTVSFTVDPERDTPALLASYAEAFQADPAKWFFLTGEPREQRRLITQGFHISVEPGAADDESAILHSVYFLLVDAQGRVRGTYDSGDPARLAQLTADLRGLLAAQRPLLDYRQLPAVNASLNGAALVLLLCGLGAIRRGRVRLHMTFMMSAFGTSVLFLASYLTYHTMRRIHEGVAHTVFQGTGWIARAYYAMLASHVLLAAIVPVLAIILLRRAFRGDFVRHRRLARWALPVWLYVSVTGVLIYVLLYHWPVAG